MADRKTQPDHSDCKAVISRGFDSTALILNATAKVLNEAGYHDAAEFLVKLTTGVETYSPS